MQKVDYKDVTWVDFEKPNSDDIVYLQENFNIHPLAIEEFFTPTFRPKATKYDNCLFLTIHIPLFDVEAKTTYPSEIDIILTKTHLITSHMKPIFQLAHFFEELQKTEGKRRLYMNETPAKLLYTTLEILLDSCFPRLDHITQKIDEIESHVFNGNEKKMVRAISLLKRDILNFRRTLMPQRSVLESITKDSSEYIPKDLIPYFQDLIGTNIRLWNTLQNNKETIESLEDTNESLLSYKINDKMRVITVFSAILLPMTLYANVLGINVNVPFQDNPDAFWIHLINMGVISFIMLVLFRLGRWI